MPSTLKPALPTTIPSSSNAVKDQSDYEVGYGKPPKHTRFKKGRSGNPKGRPKKRKRLAESFDEELRQEITIKDKTLSMQEVIIKALVQNAAKGKPAALKAVLAYMDRFDDDDETPEFDPTLEDQIALGKWMRQLEQR